MLPCRPNGRSLDKDLEEARLLQRNRAMHPDFNELEIYVIARNHTNRLSVRIEQ